MKLQNPKTGETIESAFDTDPKAADFLRGTKGDFPKSLVGHVDRGRSLSPSQKYWLHKLATDKKDNTEDGYNIENIIVSFKTAGINGLEYPQLHFKTEAFNVRINSELKVFVDGKYYGTLEHPNTFTFIGKKQDAVNALLKLLCTDPEKTCRVMGLQTGICCCCGAKLTNAESVELGIGPICRGRWGF